MVNGSLEFDLETLTSRYRFRRGVPGALLIRAGDAEDAAVFAEIDETIRAVVAFPAVEGAVEGDALAGRPGTGFGSGGMDGAGGFVAHDDGGRRRPVLPSMPWTSLPQMPQAATLMRTSSGPQVGAGASPKLNSL